MRWLLGVEWRTPEYLVREELQRDKLWCKAGLRSWGFERRLENGKGSDLARECLEEMRSRVRKKGLLSKWEEERKNWMEEKGCVEGKESAGEEGLVMGRFLEREKKRQREERWGLIEKSRYNRWYKEVKGVGVPGYLKKGWREGRWQRMARFRLGNEMREGRYWEREEGKLCRLCGMAAESWEHVWEDCGEWGAEGVWQEMVGRVLGEDGEGEEWLLKLEELRGGGGTEGKQAVGEEGEGGWERESESE